MIIKTISTMAILLSNICLAIDVPGNLFSSAALEVTANLGRAVSALYLISSQGDYIGQGKAKAYIEGQDGKFSISSNYHNGVDIRFTGPKDYWGLSFSAAEHQTLKPGIYKNATRHPFNETENPGFSISGCHRGCNTLIGEFEILEIKYGDEGQIDAFAANFIQKCEVKGAPLFGSVRYNSAIPSEARFNEIFDNTQESIFYIIKYDPAVNQSQPILIAGDKSNLSFQSLPYGGEGIEILIDSKEEGPWVLDFAAPFEEQFAARIYDPAYRYPFHSSVYAGIEILTPQGGFTQPEGEFEVLKFEKGEKGEIKSLALNFIVKNEKGEIIEGAIRFNSKFPVDLKHPYW